MLNRIKIRPIVSRKSYIRIAIAALSMSCGLLLCAMVFRQTVMPSVLSWSTTSGRVVSVEESDCLTQSRYRPPKVRTNHSQLIIYHVDGDQYSIPAGISHSLGTSANLQYDPENPENAFIAWPIPTTIVLFLLSAPFLLLGGMLLWEFEHTEQKGQRNPLPRYKRRSYKH